MRYKAFISYSHADERHAQWLQSALERYRVPRRLVGSEGAHGEVPARLRPVFRDREDLSSAADLSTRLKEELEASEFLIVVCSPAAAKSRWVNEEIRFFAERGREDRVLALVVDGDPLAGEGEENCFPAALTGSAEGARREPLAADLRRYGDGKQLALLKIIAGLLGIRLDLLRRRDAQRRLRRRLSWGFVSIVLAALLGWLTYTQVTTQAAAEAQRANTEDLLSFMLGDLDRLGSAAGEPNLAIDFAVHDERAEGLGLSGFEDDALLEQALEWREAGLELSWQGQAEAALTTFLDSKAAILELQKREGNSDRVLFELGQAEFYVGEIHAERGEPEIAREHWVRYGTLSRRLLNRDPKNPKYVMELSYTLSNLAALEHIVPVPDSDRALALMQASVQYNQMALVLEPDNAEYREQLPTGLAWLADTWLMKCSLGEALETRQQTVDQQRELVSASPGDAEVVLRLAFALTGLAGVQAQIGLDNEASASYGEAIDILRSLHQAEPENEWLEWEMLSRQYILARHLLGMGELERAATLTGPLSERVSELNDAAGKVDPQRVVDALLFEVNRARIGIALGDVAANREAISRSLDRLAELVRDKPEAGNIVNALAWVTFYYWEQFGAKPVEALALIPEGFLPTPGRIENCRMADLGARFALARGDEAEAREYVEYALNKGYFEPDFIGFCSDYGLCELP
ncbi:MAG: toll/interleukin-1 receptor domain-containing protein [Lysobacterales bacterium]